MRFKSGDDQSKRSPGDSVALVFFNPSLRTRASMQIGAYELAEMRWCWSRRNQVGSPGASRRRVMDADKTETSAEFVRVLGRYCAAIGVRTFAALKNWKLERAELRFSMRLPVLLSSDINLESAMHHPCQAMADMMTFVRS